MSVVITNYSITYNAVQTSGFANKLLAFVRENGKILAWMRPFEGLYFIKSESDLYTLQKSFFDFFEGQVTFFIQPAYPTHLHGSASIEIWNWLQMNSPAEVLALQGRS